MPNIGEPAPDFALLNQDGKLTRLSDYRGHKVILFMFPKAYTAGCTAQACSFRDDLPEFAAEGAVVLGLSNDTPTVLKAWKKDRNLGYDLLSDPKNEVISAWGVQGIPVLGLFNLPMTRRSHWVIDENGVVLDAQVGVGANNSASQALASIKTHSVRV